MVQQKKKFGQFQNKFGPKDRQGMHLIYSGGVAFCHAHCYRCRRGHREAHCVVHDVGNQFPISKGVELVQCLWLLLLKVCSYFHKIEEDNFVAQWRTMNQNWDIHSEIVEENKVDTEYERWLVDF